MEIESGKFYLTREGKKVGPAVRTTQAHYHWRVGWTVYTDAGFYFAPDGNGTQSQHALDLVKEAL